MQQPQNAPRGELGYELVTMEFLLLSLLLLPSTAFSLSISSSSSFQHLLFSCRNVLKEFSWKIYDKKTKKMFFLRNLKALSLTLLPRTHSVIINFHSSLRVMVVAEVVCVCERSICFCFPSESSFSFSRFSSISSGEKPTQVQLQWDKIFFPHLARCHVFDEKNGEKFSVDFSRDCETRLS